jgi:internalin A
MTREELLEIIKDAKWTGQESLYLSRESITRLPQEIEQLTKLSSLDISYNQLRNLPTSIKKLVKLSFLYIDNNQLTKLPESASVS